MIGMCVWANLQADVTKEEPDTLECYHAYKVHLLVAGICFSVPTIIISLVLKYFQFESLEHV